MTEPGVTVPEPTPARALAVYAHPDDPEVSAGGTLARWADEGAEVWLLVTTRGDKGSHDPATDPGELAARRARETERAVACLGLAGAVRLDHDDGALPDDARLRAEICRTVRELRPDALLCPDPTAVFFGDRYFNHRDHRVTGWAALDAIAPAAGNPHYFPEQIAAGLAVHQVSMAYLSGTLGPNCWIDVSRHLDRKIESVFCHESQLPDGAGEWFAGFLRDRAAADGRQAGVAYAEGFRRLTFAA